MPSHTIVNNRPHGGGCRDHVIVYYEAKNKEEFLELRDGMRSDVSGTVVLIVIVGVVLFSAFVWWMDR